MERLFVPVGDPAFGKIIGGQLHGHLIPGQNANIVLTHPTRDMTQQLVFILQFHPKHGVGQILKNRPLHLNNIFFAQGLLLCFSAGAASQIVEG